LMKMPAIYALLPCALVTCHRLFLLLLVDVLLERFNAAVLVLAGCRAVMTAFGFLAMTVRKARAEASGVRRPPSQCLTASRLKPNVPEKRACVIFSFLRMTLTSTSAGTLTL